jgi:hypothetical protein
MARYAIILISIDPPNDEVVNMIRLFILNIISVQHHQFSIFSFVLIVIVHDDERVAYIDKFSDFLW